MHKILIASLLLVVLLFPKSEVFAKDVPICSSENIDLNSIGIPANLNRDSNNNITGANCGEDAACAKKIEGGTAFRCHKLAEGAAAEGRPTTTGPTTSAKAAPCPGGGPGVMTAIGCVPTEPQALVEGLIKYGTLAAGGIAFLIMILAALQMITAEGNPEAIKGAQEKFYSAIIGLLLIVFAVLLMQVIGVDILGLPELGAKPPAFDTSKGDSS